MARIGRLKLKNRFLLAPMLEPNDIAFRILCKRAGCGLTYTGMVSPLSKKELILDDKPAIQIFGKNANGISSFIKKYDSYCSLWDFNLGCPSKLARKNKWGAFMHKDIENIIKIIKIIKKKTKKPVTIKIRKYENSLEIAKMCEKLIDAIAIHPRTIEQGYSGKPDIEFARKIKREISIPVIYSGDVNEKNAKELLKEFDFVFIGRAAIGNPNIFSILTNKKKYYGIKDYIKMAERYKIPFKQIKYQAINFTKGFKNASKTRQEIAKSKNLEEIKQKVF